MTTSETQKFPPLPERYARIEQANEHSFYLNDINRPFDVYLSAASLAGNMSTVNELGPLNLTPEERITQAEHNMDIYIRSLGINPGDVHILSPDRDYKTPLHVVNVDEEPLLDPAATTPTIMSKRGDFIYTRNPDTVLGVRPADCPLIVAEAETSDGPIYLMVHFAWQGVAAPGNGVKDVAKEFDKLGIDRDSLRIYVTPGGHAESFPYTNYPQDPQEKWPGNEGLFLDVRPDENGYAFNVDTPNFVYEQLLNLGLDPTQIYVDTSDTSALDSGYASNGRSMRAKTDNNRDMVIVHFNKNVSYTH